MKNLFFSVMLFMACASCSSPSSAEQDIIGQWVQPIPGMDGVQGIGIEDGGKAHSINMATLRYEAWQLHGDSLILQGQSMGNGLTVTFSDTLDIVKLTSDSLCLKRGKYIMRYMRSTE